MDSSRRGFFKKLAPLVALAPVAATKGNAAFEFDREKRYLIMCDPSCMSRSAIMSVADSLSRSDINGFVMVGSRDSIEIYELEKEA